MIGSPTYSENPSTGGCQMNGSLRMFKCQRTLQSAICTLSDNEASIDIDINGNIIEKPSRFYFKIVSGWF